MLLSVAMNSKPRFTLKQIQVSTSAKSISTQAREIKRIHTTHSVGPKVLEKVVLSPVRRITPKWNRKWAGTGRDTPGLTPTLSQANIRARLWRVAVDPLYCYGVGPLIPLKLKTKTCKDHLQRSVSFTNDSTLDLLRNRRPFGEWVYAVCRGRICRSLYRSSKVNIALNC